MRSSGTVTTGPECSSRPRWSMACPGRRRGWRRRASTAPRRVKVADGVTHFNGYGMGSYSFFNQGIDIFAANAFEVPSTLPAGSMRDLLTIFLDASHGKGGILNVINGGGGSSTIANPGVPVAGVGYPRSNR